MKRLGSIKVCGVTVPVKMGTVDDCEHLEGAYGCYALDEGVIWIVEDCPPYQIPFWIAHEALHAMINLSGAFRTTASAFGRDADSKRDLPMLNEWEENFIRVLTPHIIETFGPAIGRAR